MNTCRRSLLTILVLAGAFAAAGPFLHGTEARADDDDDARESGFSDGGLPAARDNGSSGRDDDHDDDDDDDDDRDDDDDDDEEDDDDDDDADYDRARDAVRNGQILPLRTVLERIDAKRYGRVIDVTLRRSPSSDIYEVKVRDEAGAIRTLRVNARNGALLGD